jgi:putative hemolysin
MNAKHLLFLVLLALSLGLSAFFAGSETALVSLSRIDLQTLREKGDRRAAILRTLKAHTSRLLATILIGQNLFITSASALATLLATAWLGETYGAVAAIIFSTIVLFIFAEMTPKSIAAASPVAISRAVAIPMAWTMRVLSPFVNVLVKVSTGMLRLFGVPEKAPTLTEEEMKSLFNLGLEEGVIHGEERKLLHKVLEFGDKTVRDIMVPRTKVVAIPETASFEDVKLVLKEH